MCQAPSGMSQSSSSSRRSRVPPGPLPLITCPRCGNVRIRVLISNTDANPGLRFYKCPNQLPGGPCDSWWWEDEYAAYITGPGLNLLVAAAGGTIVFGRGSWIGGFFSMAPTTTSMLFWFLIIAEVLKMFQGHRC